ncbi:unnamed protein product, partial [Symbiodinium sp. CCMP2592]
MEMDLSADPPEDPPTGSGRLDNHHLSPSSHEIGGQHHNDDLLLHLNRLAVSASTPAPLEPHALNVADDDMEDVVVEDIPPPRTPSPTAEHQADDLMVEVPSEEQSGTSLEARTGPQRVHLEPVAKAMPALGMMATPKVENTDLPASHMAQPVTPPRAEHPPKFAKGQARALVARSTAVKSKCRPKMQHAITGRPSAEDEIVASSGEEPQPHSTNSTIELVLPTPQKDGTGVEFHAIGTLRPSSGNTAPTTTATPLNQDSPWLLDRGNGETTPILNMPDWVLAALRHPPTEPAPPPPEVSAKRHKRRSANAQTSNIESVQKAEETETQSARPSDAYMQSP